MPGCEKLADVSRSEGGSLTKCTCRSRSEGSVAFANAREPRQQAKPHLARDALHPDGVMVLSLSSTPKARTRLPRVTHPEFVTNGERASPLGNERYLLVCGNLGTVRPDCADAMSDDALVIEEKEHPEGA